MLETIVITLGKSLTSFLFTQYLNSLSGVAIDGAPNWYYKEQDHEICSFHHQSGGLDGLELAKNESQRIMVKKINEIIEIVVYDNIKEYRDAEEKQLVDQFKSDKNLHLFVRKNLDYKKIKYIEEIQKTFVKACIDKQTLIDYENQRLKKLKTAISQHRSDTAFDELDSF